MLGFLFRRLTAAPGRGAPLFALATAQARLPHWYVEGKVPDTLDGRFAVLATVTALFLVRLERENAEGDRASVALTERFIEVMESEHRELGLGDPTLGKTVRKLVGALSRRVELWRATLAGEREWAGTARASLYGSGVSADSLEHATAETERLWNRLERTGLAALEEGRLE